jgi:hypothetical protein
MTNREGETRQVLGNYFLSRFKNIAGFVTGETIDKKFSDLVIGDLVIESASG